ncbi:hypothetical protein [Streptomyces sp. bgisy027]|uniref:hypothetical protein n=1 Tax=unclassified Streptomyces TaxID=2593676 RepID=UPI003D717702
MGDVTGAQGDQVVVGARVRLEVPDRHAVLCHRQRQVPGPAGGQAAVERHLVVIDLG